MKQRQKNYLRLLLLPFILVALLTGCGEDESGTDQNAAGTSGAADERKMTNYHPILDGKVRAGDTMLYDLKKLIDEGLVMEEDMQMIGLYVKEWGGMEDPNPYLLSLTYRQLLQKSLIIDFSDQMTDPTPVCDGCNDSVMLHLPATRAMVYLGMAERTLQSIIADQLKDTAVNSDYEGEMFGQTLDTTNWQQMVEKVFDTRSDRADIILFGNVLTEVIAAGDTFDHWTYGEILSVIDRMKESSEFERIGGYLRQMDLEDSNQNGTE